jgi:hypothetical protein
MPITPPWPIEVLNLLREAMAVLHRAEQADPRDPAVVAVAGDVGAAIAKLEPLARSQE